MRRSTKISISLTDGLAVMVRNGQQVHRTSLLDFYEWGYMKSKVNRKEEVHHRIFAAEGCMNDPNVPVKVHISSNFIQMSIAP
jgi:hypothetical protein